jgi:hypothetical protein
MTEVMEKETLCFGNGDFLIIEKQDTNTIPCHLKIVAGGMQELDLLENLVRHLTKRAVDLAERIANNDSRPKIRRKKSTHPTA